MNYYVEYWDCGDEARNKEIIDCINLNIKSGFFSNIFIFSCKREDKINHDITLADRITYQHIFDLKIPGINILANSDILFDESILLANKIQENEFFCLTRYEYDGRLHKYNDTYKGSDSQDVWIWKDMCKIKNADYYLGVPGCDNKIAYEAELSDYNVKNPSMSIKTYHKHESNIRSGTSGSVKYRLYPPYKLVIPSL